MNASGLVALFWFLTVPLALSAQQPDPVRWILTGRGVYSESIAVIDQQSIPAMGDSAACRWRPRCSTPGLTLALQESKREKNRNETRVRYRLLPAGLPRDKIFTLWLWPSGLEKPVPAYTGLTLDSMGALVCGDSTTLRVRVLAQVFWCRGSLPEFAVDLFGYMPGESFRIALIATDATARAYAKVYPIPLTNADAGCRLSLELIDRNTFDVWGEGFNPGKMVHMVTRSVGEAVSDSAQVRPDSTLLLRINLSHVKGKYGGQATYTVEDGRCHIEIPFPWGNALTPQ